MRIRTTIEEAAATIADRLAVGIFDRFDPPAGVLARSSVLRTVESLIESKDMTGNLGETTPILGETDFKAGSLVLFGLGDRTKFGSGAAFSAGAAVGKRLAGRPRKTVAIVVPNDFEGDRLAVASALVQGVIVGVRGPDLKKNEPARHEFEELIVVVEPNSGIDPKVLESTIERAQVIGSSVNWARDLANTPPAEKTPVRLAEIVAERAHGFGLIAEIWDETKLRQERFGGLLGVSAGSEAPPAFVVLEHRGVESDAPIALVGKGVTFDSGGLSIKPSASMEDMKADMTGAAVVAATLVAAARLKLPVHVKGYLPLTENMTGGRAMKLGDVLTLRDGKTVEVLNTDAEGRLILADALAYAVEAKPSRVLDLATLTGACMVALGPKVAGLFSNDDAFAAAIAAAAAETGERVWRMPLDEDYFELMKSHVADFKNVGGKYAGAITAAKFLERFVAKTPWVHLDIAGPSWADSDSPTQSVGATGCFVRTLIQWLEKP